MKNVEKGKRKTGTPIRVNGRSCVADEYDTVASRLIYPVVRSIEFRERAGGCGAFIPCRGSARIPAQGQKLVNSPLSTEFANTVFLAVQEINSRALPAERRDQCAALEAYAQMCRVLGARSLLRARGRRS